MVSNAYSRNERLADIDTYRSSTYRGYRISNRYLQSKKVVNDMDRKQYMTFCKYCGRHILMTRNVDTGRFTPCDADIIRFVPNENANNIFINLDGQMQRGDYTEKGEIGYKRHLLSCKGRKTA